MLEMDVLALITLSMIALLGGLRIVIIFKVVDSCSAIKSLGNAHAEIEPVSSDFKPKTESCHTDQLAAMKLAESFVYIHNRIHMALFDEKVTPTVSGSFSELNFKFVPMLQTVADIIQRRSITFSDKFLFKAPSLEDIFRFNELAMDLQQRSPTTKIVFQAGSDQFSQATFAFLVGCHLMLSHGLGFEETYLAVSRIPGAIEPRGQDLPSISVRGCLRAFCRAKCHNWICFTESEASQPSEDVSSIHVEEYLHYARCTSFRSLLKAEYICTMPIHLGQTRRPHEKAASPSPPSFQAPASTAGSFRQDESVISTERGGGSNAPVDACISQNNGPIGPHIRKTLWRC